MAKTIVEINAGIRTMAGTVLKYGRTGEIVKDKAPKIFRKEFFELLFEQPYTKTEFGVKKLEEIGILKSEKIGRENLYLTTGLIEILKH